MDAKPTVSEMLPFFIVIAMLILFIIFCFKMVVASSKARKIRKQNLQNAKKLGMTYCATFRHVNGLPLAENVFCEVSSYPDRLEFRSGTTVVNLARGKITDMSIKTDTEIQKQVVSSIGSAVAGGLVFGPLGTIIGGRAKTKKTETVSQYLIITYQKDSGELAHIGFDGINHVAYNLVQEFHEQNKNPGVQIDL